MATKHGLTVGFPSTGKRGRYSPEYRAWQSIKDRCTNPRTKKWHLWGGAGVRMHAAWLNDPAAFMTYVGPRPSPQHSIDRYPDHNGNYEPGNVRWATAVEQGRNRRDTKLTDDSVAQIRVLLEKAANEVQRPRTDGARGFMPKELSQAKIAKMFGVSKTTIQYIARGQSWR